MASSEPVTGSKTLSDILASIDNKKNSDSRSGIDWGKHAPRRPPEAIVLPGDRTITV
jgi:hypothetical protein